MNFHGSNTRLMTGKVEKSIYATGSTFERWCISDLKKKKKHRMKSCKCNDVNIDNFATRVRHASLFFSKQDANSLLNPKRPKWFETLWSMQKCLQKTY